MSVLKVDFDMILMTLLRDGFAGSELGEVTVGTDLPADLIGVTPFVMARRVAGALVDPRFLDRAVVDIQGWAVGPDGRGAASDLMLEARGILHDAWEAQTVTPYGHLSSFREYEAPTELRDRDQDDDLWRYQALYSIAFH